jgi:putative acetyltransferase
MIVDIAVRIERQQDVPAVADLLEAAFAEEGAAIVDLVADLRGHACGRDGLAFVAESAGGILGCTLVTRSRLDTPERLVDVGVLSPLAVAPAAQRSGVGRALVERALAAAESAGLPALFLEGDPAYYSRLGFRPGAPLGFRKPSLRIPDSAFQVVLLPGYEPWMTGTLVYAEPFWDHDCVGLRENAAPGPTPTSAPH